MILKYIRTDKAKRLNLMLHKQHDWDCGWDLPVCWPEELGTDAIQIRPGEVKDIPSGISIYITPGYWAEVKARGSSFKNKNLHIHDAVWDSGCVAELQVAIKNMSDKHIIIRDGQRIAQVVFHKEVPIDQFVELEKFPSTDRGVCCMGSTGE